MSYQSEISNYDKSVLAQYEARRAIEIFINEITEDLEILKQESFQRHTPQFHDEVEYYNYFHNLIPSSLLLSECYKAFLKVYIEEGKNLFEAVSAFLEVYKSN